MDATVTVPQFEIEFDLTYHLPAHMAAPPVSCCYHEAAIEGDRLTLQFDRRATDAYHIRPWFPACPAAAGAPPLLVSVPGVGTYHARPLVRTHIGPREVCVLQLLEPPAQSEEDLGGQHQIEEPLAGQLGGILDV